MKVWLFLLKKEFRLMRMFFFIDAGVLLFLGLLGLILGSAYHAGAVAIILLIGIGGHFLYMIVFMIASLAAEKRNAPTWLQSPQHAFVLLSAKFAAGFIGMILSLLTDFLLFLLVVYVAFPNGFTTDEPLSFLTLVTGYMKGYALTFAPFLIVQALFIASIAVFVYFIGDILKYTIKGWRWILSFILYFVIMGLSGWFSHTPVYDLLFHWGAFQVMHPMAQGSNQAMDPHVHAHWNVSMFQYGGDLLYGLLIAAFGFLATAWMLDKKAEV